MIDTEKEEVELSSVRKRQEYRRSRKAELAKGVSSGNALRSPVTSAHAALSKDEDDSAAASAVHEGEYVLRRTTDSVYSRKLYQHGSYPDKTAGVSQEAGESRAKRIQKKEIQRGYHSPKAKSAASSAGKRFSKDERAARKATEGTKDTLKAIGNFINEHPMAALVIAGCLFFLIVGVSMCSTCTSMIPGGGSVVSATSFTAEDKDILAAEQIYSQMEKALAESLEKEKEEYLQNGYDGRCVHTVEITIEPEIGHDPYELVSLLTVLHGSFREKDIKKTLQKLLGLQYEKRILSTVPETEPELSGMDIDEEIEDPSEEPEAVLLTIVIKNRGIDGVLEELKLNEEQKQQFRLLVLTKGNRPDLFD